MAAQSPSILPVRSHQEPSLQTLPIPLQSTDSQLFPLTKVKIESARQDPPLSQVFQVCVQLENALGHNCQKEQIKLGEESGRAITKIEIQSLESGVCILQRSNGGYRPFRCLPIETRKIFKAIIQNQEIVADEDPRVVEAARRIIAIPPHDQHGLPLKVLSRFAFDRKILLEAFELKTSPIRAFMKQVGIVDLYPHPSIPELCIFGLLPGSSQDNIGRKLTELDMKNGISTLNPTPENQLWGALGLMLKTMILLGTETFDFSLLSRHLAEEDLRSLRWMVATPEGKAAYQKILEGDPQHAAIIKVMGSLSLQEIDGVKVNPKIRETYEFILRALDAIANFSIQRVGNQRWAVVGQQDVEFLNWLRGSPEGKEAAAQAQELFPEAGQNLIQACLLAEIIPLPEAIRTLANEWQRSMRARFEKN